MTKKIEEEKRFNLKRYMKKKCKDFVFDGKKNERRQRDFSAELKRKFNSIIITVKDNCLDTSYTRKHKLFYV